MVVEENNKKPQTTCFDSIRDKNNIFGFDNDDDKLVGLGKMFISYVTSLLFINFVCTPEINELSLSFCLFLEFHRHKRDL